MAVKDMFDKLDDIVYEPVKGICNWIQEPLKGFESKRELKKMQQQADIAMQMQKNDAVLEAYNARQQAELEVDTRRWQAEIDQMIADQEDARRDKLVESLKNYQITMATAIQDIVNNIGSMSLELRRQANELVLEKTKEYTALQDKAKTQSMSELKEAKEMFSDDPDTFQMLRSSIIEERRSAIDLAGRFIKELAEDLNRFTQNTDMLMNKGMENIDKYLSPMSNALGVSSSATAALKEKTKQIEDGNIH